MFKTGNSKLIPAVSENPAIIIATTTSSMRELLEPIGERWERLIDDLILVSPVAINNVIVSDTLIVGLSIHSLYKTQPTPNIYPPNYRYKR